MGKWALVPLLLLSGCVHRLAVVYESEEAALTGSQIYIGAQKSESQIKPILPEVKHESSI